MNYNKTTKPKLIEMLKTAQADNVRLAGKADKAEEIATATMANNAALREDVETLEEKLKQIRAGRDAKFDNGGRITYCRDRAMGRCGVADHDCKEHIDQSARLEREKKELEDKIADLEKQIAGDGKVDGVFSEGDKAKILWCDDPNNWPYTRVGIDVEVEYIRGDTGKVYVGFSDSGDGVRDNGGLISVKYLMPPCPSCKAKDAEIDETKRSRSAVSNECSDLSEKIDQLKKESHRDWLKSDKTDTELFNKTLEYKELKQLYENQQSTIESLQSDFDATHTMNMHLRDAVIRGQIEVSKVRSGEVE